MRCLHVISEMCWCIVLLKDTISSNAADRWQQFLHQQHFSIALSACSPKLSKNWGWYVTEFRYCNRDLMDLLKVVRMHRIQLALMSRCLVAIEYWRTRWFLANVNSRQRLLYAVARPSVCRLSVCNARAPYSGGCNFPQYFYGIWYLGHPLTSTENFTEIVPGEPLRRGS